MKSFKKALVTGAAGAIGTEICRELAEKGVSLVACGTNEASLAELATKLGGLTTIDTVVTDIADHEGLEKILLDVVDQHADIDLLILNAGVDKQQRAEDLDWRLAKLHFDVNTTSNYVFLSVFVPYFLKNGSGHVSSVISLGGLLGCPYEHAYNGSKAAMLMIMDGYRAELCDRNITFTSVLPGFVKTPMSDNNSFVIKSSMTPQSAAKKIVDGTFKRKPYLRFPFSTWLQIRVMGLLPVGLRNTLIRREVQF